MSWNLNPVGADPFIEVIYADLKNIEYPMLADVKKEPTGALGVLQGYLSPEVLSDSAYQRAGLRMNSLSKPQNGKDKFEMMAFTVSVVNGCTTCVSSHEKALTDIGVSRDQISMS